jgi:hypothetical protein
MWSMPLSAQVHGKFGELPQVSVGKGLKTPLHHFLQTAYLMPVHFVKG